MKPSLKTTSALVQVLSVLTSKEPTVWPAPPSSARYTPLTVISGKAATRTCHFGASHASVAPLLTGNSNLPGATRVVMVIMTPHPPLQGGTGMQGYPGLPSPAPGFTGRPAGVLPRPHSAAAIPKRRGSQTADD